MKICSKCKVLKAYSQFSKCKSHKDGLRSHCKDCMRQHRKNTELKSTQIDPYSLFDLSGEHYTKLCTKCNCIKSYLEFYKQKSNKDGLRSWCKQCFLANCKQYDIENKQSILINKRKYISNRRKTDINFKLLDSLRIRLRQAIKNNWKAGSAVRDLGCSVDFLKQYIESKFHESMTWDNWGSVWELDHVKELHTFDLTDRKQFLEACHYSNLQPLTIEEHVKKTTKNKYNKRSNEVYLPNSNLRVK